MHIVPNCCGNHVSFARALNDGWFYTYLSWDTWQCLETFLVLTSGWVLPTFSRWSPGRLPNTLQDTRQSPRWWVVWLKILIVLGMRKPSLQIEISFLFHICFGSYLWEFVIIIISEKILLSFRYYSSHFLWSFLLEFWLDIFSFNCPYSITLSSFSLNSNCFSIQYVRSSFLRVILQFTKSHYKSPFNSAHSVIQSIYWFLILKVMWIFYS